MALRRAAMLVVMQLLRMALQLGAFCIELCDRQLRGLLLVLLRGLLLVMLRGVLLVVLRGLLLEMLRGLLLVLQIRCVWRTLLDDHMRRSSAVSRGTHDCLNQMARTHGCHVRQVRFSTGRCSMGYFAFGRRLGSGLPVYSEQLNLRSRTAFTIRVISRHITPSRRLLTHSCNHWCQIYECGGAFSYVRTSLDRPLIE